MNIIKIIKNSHATLNFSLKELIILRNALSVVCEEIEEWEFQIRLGIDLKDGLVTLAALDSILGIMEKKPQPHIHLFASITDD